MTEDVEQLDNSPAQQDQTDYFASVIGTQFRIKCWAFFDNSQTHAKNSGITLEEMKLYLKMPKCETSSFRE
ncbi:MAG TPA: hypothetical protein DD473_03505 [Planctomycetaceae bacterium]|nr:hypothetical protein [Planctomycetaceae bacterium]